MSISPVQFGKLTIQTPGLVSTPESDLNFATVTNAPVTAIAPRKGRFLTTALVFEDRHKDAFEGREVVAEAGMRPTRFVDQQLFLNVTSIDGKPPEADKTGVADQLARLWQPFSQSFTPPIALVRHVMAGNKL